MSPLQRPITDLGTAATHAPLSHHLTSLLEALGIRHAFGVSGGAIGALWHSLHQSDIEVMHFRHEAGAAFAAIESYFVTGVPAAVFVTSGPGLTNALTGAYAARYDGAKLLLLSPATAASGRGRRAFQETSSATLPSGLFEDGPLFDYATTISSGDELGQVARRLAMGFSRPGTFVAHVSVPTSLQTALTEARAWPSVRVAPAAPSEESVKECASLLNEAPFVIWVGHGARDDAPLVRELAQQSGAAVMCSPRAKGIVSERDPQYLGVTGFAGHEQVLHYMRESRPARVLVLGSRLGELTSFFDQELTPAEGFIHVDVDASVFGAAYPDSETLGVQADIGAFLRALLPHIEKRVPSGLPRPQPEPMRLMAEGRGVDPRAVMRAIQDVVVDESEGMVITEAGNSFAWGTHCLRFEDAKRYRVSTGCAAMGHAATGVLGSALVADRPSVAVVGDGAMLMNSEVSTAVHYGIPAIWVVLNDARYNMVCQGAAQLGLRGLDAEIPACDFVQIARGMGASGIRVEREDELEAALRAALAANAPYVIDVQIDHQVAAPTGNRNAHLASQGINRNLQDGAL